MIWKAATLLFAVTAVALTACEGSNGLPGQALTDVQTLQNERVKSPIQHVVIVIQENRSFDNLFDCFKGTDCVKRGKEKVKQGSTYVDKWVDIEPQKLVPTPSPNKKIGNTDIGHCYFSFTTAYDGGKMDGFNLEPKGACPRSTNSGYQPIGTFPYQYIEHTEIAPYWDMAEQYVLADRMFQTQGSGSFTAHQDLIRGGTIVDSSDDSMIDTPTQMPWGCDAPNLKSDRTDLITPGLQFELDKGPPPCTSDFPIGSAAYKTLGDLLDAQQIGWRYYSPCFEASPQSGPCNGKCNINCTTGPGALLNAFDVIYRVRNSPEWGTNVSMPQTNIFTDITNNQLQAVSWVIPSQGDSDHPGDVQDDGPQWVASIVNAVGQSSYWNSSAIIVLWDDWGGMYDHVVPPGSRDTQGGPGFRVPMIVISPYVGQGKVYHAKYEFGSIIRYIEENWKLGSLGTTDSTSQSIINMFDYKQQPRAFTSIPSSLSIDHFKHEPRFSAPADTE